MVRFSLSGLLGLLALADSAGAATWAELAEKHVGALVEKGHVVGAALLIRRGDEEAQFFFGEKEWKGGVAPTASTIFEIGSITKTFCTTLLAQAVHDGRLSLDTPIEECLPPEVKAPQYEGQSITLGSLADHSSGLPRLPDNLELKNDINPYVAYDEAALFVFLNGHQLERSPGERYEYSNLGYGLLGHLLGRRADTDFAGLLQDQLLQPLAMKSTVLSRESVEVADLAQPYRPSGIRLFGGGFKDSSNWDFQVIAPAGALLSNLEDMSRYLAALLNPEGTMMAPLTEMLFQERKHVVNSVSVALGWHLAALDDGRTLVWHNGGTGGYSTFMAFETKSQTGVVLLCNTANTAQVDQGAYALFGALLEATE